MYFIVEQLRSNAVAAANNGPLKIQMENERQQKPTLMQLTNAEQQLMEHLWTLEKAFMKDLLDAFPKPKPATTTVATLLKRMIDKKFVAYNEFGNSREYYPLIKKTDYFSQHVNGLIKSFFGNSASQFASFFTTETGLTKKELKELRAIIDSELQKKKK